MIESLTGQGINVRHACRALVVSESGYYAWKGRPGLDDLKEGDRVRLIGKITTLSRKCSQSGFTAMNTIRRIVFHAPPVAS